MVDTNTLVAPAASTFYSEDGSSTFKNIYTQRHVPEVSNLES
jgi:hypothetical protein